MSLKPGASLGAYTVVGALGAGGMGEVYRAKDTKLDRDVAIKVLPESFALDADRVARFTREAKTLAALNHPNIAQIYGIEEQDGTRALVMELVEGEDLSGVIARGAMPLVDVLPIARQIADALEAAHEQGIVHRDLKPQNIKIRPDGTVKVLDFGLAKAIGPDGAGATADAMNSPTMTARATEMGMIIGTAAYMAPEQARGRAVDRRADIWAFGVVLYEMLSGRRAFEGEDVSITLANVMKDDVAWDALPKDLPAPLRTLLGRCLERDVKKRLSWIGEARLALDSPSTSQAPAAGQTAAPSRRASLVWLGVTVAVAAVTGLVVWQIRAPKPAAEERLEMTSPAATPPQLAVISPDATMVAILADDKLWIRKLDEFTATVVDGSEGAHTAFWSPDSTNLGFQARGKLYRVAAHGGTPIAIGSVPAEFTPAGGAAWGADGRIVFTTGASTLMQIKADGAEPASDMFALDPAKDEDIHDAGLLPDGKTAIFALHPAQVSRSPYPIQTFADGVRRSVFAGAPGSRLGHPRYSPTGHLLFEMSGDLWALPFSLETHASTGDPVKVVDNARAVSVANDGTMVMLSGRASTAVFLTEISATGRPGAVIGKTRAVMPRVSTDGRWIAAVTGFGVDTDISIFDRELNTERRLTFEPGPDDLPAWSPDGKTIVYTCGEALCARPADGSGARVELAPSVTAGEVTSDGRRIAFIRGTSRESAIYVADLGPAGLTGPAGPPTAVVTAPSMRAFDVSPNGRFVAYHSRETGGDAVFVTRFPVAEGKWEVPVRSATQPRWSADGKHLFVFDELSRVVDVPVDASTTFVAGTPVVRTAGLQTNIGYDRMKDGQSFIIPVSPSATDQQTRILVIRNWSPK